MLIQPSSRVLSQTAQRRRWAVLIASLAPIAGAFIYPLLKIPHSKCLFQTLFGFPSPGCGLTRSFIAVTKANLPQAFSYHLFGPLLFAVLLLTSAHIVLELITRKALITPYVRFLHQPRNLGYGSVFLALMFLSYYAIRLYARYSIESPLGLSQLNLWQSLVIGAQAL
jgi:Protein of unknown function (DUF2752)